MKKSFFFYKELTLAEVGKTGTHEVYVRLPNNFDYESFFHNSSIQNGTVIEVNFEAIDTTDGMNMNQPMRFVYFANSNQEKRIPSLNPLFKRHNVNEGDIVCIESRLIDETVSYYIHFYKKGEIQVNPNSIYFSKIDKDISRRIKDSYNNHPLQQIYYGAPGTGKSHEIKEKTKGESVIRTTFHPDSDYSTFVGAYKPTMDNVDTKVVPVVLGESGTVFNKNEGTYKEKRIVYQFVMQAFLKAYLGAWKKYAEANGNDVRPQYLVIEEINRGNCAQIFGDLFQLLDRGDNGFSEYPIEADADLQQEIERAFKEHNDYKLKEGVKINAEGVLEDYTSNYGVTLSEDIQSGRVLLLPSNLFIWATMNTSDQSLFPIDSAFKRRWDWKYMPIDTKKENWYIKVGNNRYSWTAFLEKVNNELLTDETAEDKHLGFYFCKAENNEIATEIFVGKVLFYLWNDVFKIYGIPSAIGSSKDWGYSKFYNPDGSVNEQKLTDLMNQLKIEAEGSVDGIANGQIEEQS